MPTAAPPAPTLVPAARAPRRAALLAGLRRWAWLALPLAAALLVGWLRVWSPVRVGVVPVERGTIQIEAFGRGTVESQRQAAVGFDLVGRLSDVLVDEGARVTLGQELARLETVQAEADLRSAQTGIAAARAALQRLAADEARARAVLVTAEREAARVQTLFRSGAVTGTTHDEATDQLRIARAELDRVLGQRAEATRGIEVASGGAEQRRVTMVRATLLAPFEGLVTRRLREPGDTVAVGTTVLRIVDTSSVYVSAAIDETVLHQLAVGQRATLVFPGTTTVTAGTVSRIAWEADRQTHELLVDITPERLVQRVAIGQRADVRITLGERTGVLRLPTRLLRHDHAGAFVYVDRGGTVAIARPVLGATGGADVEVVSGLAEGDRVLDSTTTLRPGRRWVAR